MEIVGVDFSGAKTDDRTWVAQGTLEHGSLTLQDCRPVPRASLAELLLSLPGGSVAALDFPFSVPKVFAYFWQPGATSMPDLWAAASAIDLSQFLDFRDGFVARYGEPKRRCDLRFPECYSCLHKANPNMVPMTFYGMQMLGPLFQAGCAVPPLEAPDTDRPQNKSKAVLLEAMPGAALKAMNLPYKGYKKGSNALLLRQRILDGLETRSEFAIKNLRRFRELCLGSDDALDAVVALLEGWLYAPVYLQSPERSFSQDTPDKTLR